MQVYVYLICLFFLAGLMSILRAVYQSLKMLLYASSPERPRFTRFISILLPTFSVPSS